jgi:hypothetical protein
MDIDIIFPWINLHFDCVMCESSSYILFLIMMHTYQTADIVHRMEIMNLTKNLCIIFLFVNLFIRVIFSGVTDEGKGVKIECSAVVEDSPVTPPVTEAKVIFRHIIFYCIYISNLL